MSTLKATTSATSRVVEAPVASKPKHIPEWIEWYDHCGFEENRWRTSEDWESLGPIRIVTLGFAVHETDQIVIVVPHYDSENEKGVGEMCILKTDIIVRRPLEVE
jgi:hypothetical protein